jgi:hypothetical protein
MLKDISIIDVSGARACVTPITGRSFRILQWLLGANFFLVVNLAFE